MAGMYNSQRRIPDPSDYRRAPTQQSASRSRPLVRWHDPFRAVLALGRREARRGLVFGFPRVALGRRATVRASSAVDVGESPPPSRAPGRALK